MQWWLNLRMTCLQFNSTIVLFIDLLWAILRIPLFYFAEKQCRDLFSTARQLIKEHSAFCVLFLSLPLDNTFCWCTMG